MGNPVALKALLLTREATTVAGFSAICSELGIEAQSQPDARDIGPQLSEHKYAAVIVDFDDAEARERHLPVLRESRLNKTSVVIAVAASAKNLERALQCRAHFVLKRPMQEVDIRRTLRAAYDFMLTDRRRQFRCSAILPVRLTLMRSGASFECSTVNLSAKGVAIYSSMRLKPAESVDLEIVLPDGFVVHASGIVVWDDGLGKSGIHFQVRTPEIRQKLDTWLNAQAAAMARLELTSREFAHILPLKDNNGERDEIESV
jgi:hypothetical protein